MENKKMTLREELELKKKAEQKEADRESNLIYKFNKLAKQEGIQELSDDYDTAELEGIIISAINMKKGQTLFKDYETKKLIGTLFHEKNPEYFMCQKEPWYITLKQYAYTAIYLKWYFENIYVAIPGVCVKEILLYDGGNWHADDMGKIGFKPIGHLFNPPWVTSKDNFEMVKTLYTRSKDESEIWEIVAEKSFAAMIEKVKQILSRVRLTNVEHATSLIDTSEKVVLNAVRAREAILKQMEASRDELEKLEKQYGITTVCLLPTGRAGNLVLVKYNLICNIILTRDSERVHINSIQYGVFSQADSVMTSNNTEVAFTHKIVLPSVSTKKESIVAHTMAGSLLGGTVGGMIGAANAVQTNINRQIMRNNYQPIYRDAKAETIEVTAKFSYNDQTMYWDIKKVYVLANESKYGDINVFMEALYDIKRMTNILYGNLLKEYMLDSESNATFSEDKFKQYTKEKISSFGERFPENETLNELVISLDKVSATEEATRKLMTEEMSEKTKQTQKYNLEKQELEQLISSLQKEKEEAGFFKFSAKKQLEERIAVNQEKLQGLSRENEREKREVEQKYENKKKASQREIKQLNVAIASKMDIVAELMYREMMQQEQRLF